MSWFTWPFRLLRLALWFAGRLGASNLAVVRDVAVRRQRSSPVVVAYPTLCDSDLEVTLLGIMISLTPGTLLLATRDAPHAPGEGPHRGHAGSRLYVHVMYADTAEQAFQELRRDERALLTAIRREGAPR